jgi:hypothetical protein
MRCHDMTTPFPARRQSPFVVCGCSILPRLIRCALDKPARRVTHDLCITRARGYTTRGRFTSNSARCGFGRRRRGVPPFPGRGSQMTERRAIMLKSLKVGSHGSGRPGSSWQTPGMGYITLRHKVDILCPYMRMHTTHSRGFPASVPAPAPALPSGRLVLGHPIVASRPMACGT